MRFESISRQTQKWKKDLEIEIENYQKVKREEAFRYYSGMTNQKPAIISYWNFR